MEGLLEATCNVTDGLMYWNEGLRVGNKPCSDNTCSLELFVDEMRLSSAVRYSGDFVPEQRIDVDPDTVALWHFDEGTGNTANDATGNGWDFAFLGSMAWTGDTACSPP